MAIATGGGLLVHAEDARLFAVERKRLAEPIEIPSRGLKVRKGGLDAGEQHHHQSTGGIVDVHQLALITQVRIMYIVGMLPSL